MYFIHDRNGARVLKTHGRAWRWTAAGLGALALAVWPCSRATAQTNAMVGGAYTNWPTAWTAIPTLNDPADPVTGRQDFIGDSNNPCGYWTTDASYVYVRMRVNVTNAYSNTFSDSHFVMIDIVGSGKTNVPDWAFVWDSKSADNTRHGLELLTNAGAGTTWASVTMNDVDGSSGQKIAPPDFGVTNGDGYVRTIGAVATTNFGLTTLIDVAASWSYLTAVTGLRRGQQWRIQFASIAGANDHNSINSDVAANTNPSGANSLTNWSAPFLVTASEAEPRSRGTVWTVK